MKVIMIGGQPIPQRYAQCLGKLCHAFGCSYGGTELLATAFHVATNIDHFSDHCCGNPVKGVGIKIVDDNGDIVPVGVQGEIYVRSKGLFKEYYNDPEKTRQAFTPDGWFRTDDLGHMTENGILYVKGRKSDIIISGTMKVLPSVLEGVLSS
ncbi:MAG: class I adenylate-forming enzyme family protein, partial [Sedimenticola sp.]